MNNLSRYSRQIRLPEFGMEGQERLLAGSVMVIGAGGLGCPLLMYLAEAGVGKIGILDHDLIEESNLQRQPLYTFEDMGKAKALVAAERILALNPDIEVTARQEKLTSDNALEWVSGYDIIADCSDNFTTRYLINDACVRTDKPWVFAAIEGWQGQVSVFNLTNDKGEPGPTYRCLFPEPPEAWEAPDCDTIGVMATLPAVIGSLQANEVIKCLSGVGTPLSGKLLTADLLDNHYYTFQFSRNNEAVARLLRTELKPDETPLGNLEIDTLALEHGEYTLVDIREDFEWEEDPIVPMNIPYHTLISQPDLLDSAKEYVLICDKGKRSAILAKTLRKKYSMSQVYSLKGGIESLRRKG